MKKKTLLSLLVFLFLLQNKAYAAPFRLEGTITNIKDSTFITLSYTVSEHGQWNTVNDSSVVRNGRFVFQGDIEDITPATIYVSNYVVMMYMEPNPMKLHIDTDHLYQYQLTGTRIEKENKILRKEVPALEIRYNHLHHLINHIEILNTLQPDDSRYDSLRQQISQEVEINDTNIRLLQNQFLDFAKKHLSFQIVPHLLTFSIGAADIDSIHNLYNRIPEENKKSLMGRHASYIIGKKKREKDILRTTAEEALAPDFIRKSFAGDSIRLSDYTRKGHVVLIDFWASWCIPCLKSMPKIEELYTRYKDKGLRVIGISIDNQTEDWEKAIQKHQLNLWPQIISKDMIHEDDPFKFSEHRLGDVYGADAVPLYVLIDKQGKITGRWHHLGEEQILLIDRLLKTDQQP